MPAKTTQNGLGTASLLIAIVALATASSVHGVTVTGIVLGIVSLVVGPIFIAVWAAIVIAGIRTHNYNDCIQRAGPDKYLQQICEW